MLVDGLRGVVIRTSKLGGDALIDFGTGRRRWCPKATLTLVSSLVSNAAKRCASPPAGVPGFGSASCLGCEKPVSENAGYLLIAGTREWTHLIEMDPATGHGRATDLNSDPPSLHLLLGVCHPGCGDLARTMITHGFVTFPNDLPTVHWEHDET